MVETAKQRGMQHPGSDYALACYQLLEAAQVWNVPLSEIGLSGFDTADLLDDKRRIA